MVAQRYPDGQQPVADIIRILGHVCRTSEVLAMCGLDVSRSYT